MKKRVMSILLAMAIFLSVFVFTPTDKVEAKQTEGKTETCWVVKNKNSNGNWDIAGAKKDKKAKFTGKWFYEDGNWHLWNISECGPRGSHIKSSFVVCSSGTYYFDSNGRMCKNKMFTCGARGGAFYYADASGKIVMNQFKKTTKLPDTKETSTIKNTYYFGTDGASYFGWKKINGKQYYFTYKKICDKNNRVIFGKYAVLSQRNSVDDSIFKITLNVIDVKKYSFNKNGVMRTGWIKGNKGYYYAQKDGALIISKKTTIGGKSYWFNSNGIMQANKWNKVKNSWYYYGADGAMLKNTSKKIGNKVYKFNKNGVCTNP